MSTPSVVRLRSILRWCGCAVAVAALVLAASAGLEGVKQADAVSCLEGDVVTPFFKRLTAVREERKARVVAYFASTNRLAEGVVDDPVMLDAFAGLRHGGRGLHPDEDLLLDAYYVVNYGEFFDILFVDRGGFVFHSFRRESDYRASLFDGALSGTKLAQSLPKVRQAMFIDYQHYPPSDEPAAFFAVPVYATAGGEIDADGGGLLGWFVLQCPLNKLNAILVDRRGLGRTGEVYLVNTEQRMVTESRFRPEPASLRLAVNTAATTMAFESGAGERVIEDYRGVRVLSSFDSFGVFGTTWVIVAEMDEAEAVTEHYRRHRDAYVGEIGRLLACAPPRPHVGTTYRGPCRRVDMNEYVRSTPGTGLRTCGVSVCTALVATLPGRFGYLAHIGPTDLVYGQPDLGHNDCLGGMLTRLRQYDVYPCELSALEFTIVATHEVSFAGIVDRLLDLGVELDQIRFAYNPRAEYANVLLVPEDGTVQIEWFAASEAGIPTLGCDVETLGSVIQGIASTRR